MAARIAIIAITTNNSINVNPLLIIENPLRSSKCARPCLACQLLELMPEAVLFVYVTIAA
jgi:hypothetical protein